MGARNQPSLYLILLLMAGTMTACTGSVRPSDPDYADRASCYRETGEKYKVFGSMNSAKVDACVKEKISKRQARLERLQAKEARQEEALRKSNLIRKKQEEKHQAMIAALKKKCGTDFDKLRIGMSVSRWKECWPPHHYNRYRLTSQINRKDGIVSTYEVLPVFRDLCDTYMPPCAIYVMDNKVVGWK